MGGDVQVIMVSCETLAIFITKPAGTNLIPIYEALSFDTSSDNPNQGSKRETIRTAIVAALQHYGLAFPRDRDNVRAIGHIDGIPAAGSCGDTTVTVSAAEGEHMGVLAALTLAVFLGFQ